jgi:hypothetical protein
MSRKWSLLFLTIVLVLGQSMLTGAHAADTTFRTGLNYDWWQSDEDDSGMQFYIPIEAGADYNDLSFQVLGTYAYTTVNPSGGSRESLSDFTDTKLIFSYEILNRFAFDMLFGLGFNLPTGHTDLKEKELVLIVPSDLISITTFGEGFNINPTLIISREWEYWVAGIGLGYTWRGEYDYSFEVEDYDPGDIISVTAEIGHDLSPNWYGKLFGEYLSYEKDEVDGREFYQEGNVLLIGLGAEYTRSDWELAFTLLSIFRDKSKFLDGTRILTEERNSHGDEWIADIAYRYFLDDETKLNANLALLWIDENEYSSTSPYYIGKRQKITLGCSVDKTLRQDIEGSVKLKGFYMDDEMNWYHPQDLKYTGLSLGVSIISHF